METPDAAVAASSPADQVLSIDDLSPEDRQSWLLNGTPTVPSKAESTPAKESATPEKVETAPVPEPGLQQEPKKKDGESRKAELAQEIQDLLEKRKALRAEVEGKSEKPESQPGKPVRPTHPGKAPVWDGSKPYAQYEAEREAYDAKVDAFDASLAEYEKATLAYQAEETRKQIEQEFTSRQRRAEHQKAKDQAVQEFGPEFDDAYAAVDKSVSGDFGSALLECQNWPALVMTHRADLEALSKQFEQNPIAAVLALGRLDSEKTPAKPQSTKAPRPSSDIAGRNASPSDPIRAAVESGDFETYMRLANSRDLKRA